MTSRKPPNKPQERAAYLDACLKRMFKQYAKNASPIDCNLKNLWDGVDVTEMAENLLFSNDETRVILSQGQYSHIFPHPHVFLKCSICDKLCPSDMPKDQMMILFNSPSTLLPLCTACSEVLGKNGGGALPI